MSDVAFIGTGAMGSRMARRLVDAGHSVRVWNRTQAKADALIEAGAMRAFTPADAALDAQVVITMISDEAALRDVVKGEEGLANGVSSGATVIEMSTVGPGAIEWLREALPERADLLDAPVLGSLSEAESGVLKIFGAGEAATLKRWRDLLAVMGDPIHVGPLGMGKAAKLVANSTLFGSLGVLGEAIALGDGLGLPRDVTYEVLSATPIAPQAERRRGAIESGDFPKRFSLALARKDAGLVGEAAKQASVDLRVATAAREWLDDADEAGWGERDYSTLIAFILDQ